MVILFRGFFWSLTQIEGHFLSRNAQTSLPKGWEAFEH
jgi:hypothetical protein